MVFFIRFLCVQWSWCLHSSTSLYFAEITNNPSKCVPGLARDCTFILLRWKSYFAWFNQQPLKKQPGKHTEETWSRAWAPEFLLVLMITLTFGKASAKASSHCVTSRVRWQYDLMNRMCLCMVVSGLNTKQACGGTIPKRGPFNQSERSKCK